MAILDMFKKKDAKVNPLSMVMDFLSNPNKLKNETITNVASKIEGEAFDVIYDLKNLYLQENEVMASILLFKKEGEMHYVLCTFDADDRIVRQLEVENVREKLLGMADNLKLF